MWVIALAVFCPASALCFSFANWTALFVEYLKRKYDMIDLTWKRNYQMVLALSTETQIICGQNVRSSLDFHLHNSIQILGVEQFRLFLTHF